jgi:hypothetical protein
MILLFGDHQPRWPPASIPRCWAQRGHLGCRHRPEAQAVPRHWANYDIPRPRGWSCPSTNCRSVGRDRQPAPDGYQQFLNELRQTVPVVNAVGFRTPTAPGCAGAASSPRGPRPP